MKKMLLAGTGLALSVLAGPPAHANSSDVVNGGCKYSTTYGVPTAAGDMWSGVQAEQSTTTTGDATRQPIGATVTCWIEVDGVPAPGTTHSYGDVAGMTGTQAGASPVSVDDHGSDNVSACQSVAFADGTTTWTTCFIWGDVVQLPPQVVIDTVDAVVATVDAVVCPQLGGCSASAPAGSSL
jgi:hypothetical protein